MAIFNENEKHLWEEALLLAVLSLAIFLLWNMEGHEMSPTESAYALQICEWEETGCFTVLGHLSPDTPICYLTLVRETHNFGLSMEQSLRLMTIIPHLLLMLLVFYTVHRNHGLYSACASSAFLLSFFILHKSFGYGTPLPLTALGMYGGWVLWMEVGARKAKWNCAWISLGILAGLIYWNGGYLMLLLFLLPLAFQHKSVKLREKAMTYQLGFACFVLLVGIAIAAVQSSIQGLPELPQRTEDSHITLNDIQAYLHGVLLYPFKWFWYMLPGSLFIWAPFCAALISMDSKPLFGKIHRCIFNTMFLLMWLLPFFHDKDLCLMAPVTAVLLGTKFEIVVRRYGSKMQGVLKALAAVALVLCALLIWHVNSMAMGPLDCLAKIPWAWMEKLSQCLKQFLPAGGDVAKLSLQFLQVAIALATVLCAFLFLTIKNGNRLRISLCSVFALLFCSCAMVYLFFRDIQYSKKKTSVTEFVDHMEKSVGEQPRPVIYTNLFGKYPEYYCFMRKAEGRKVKYIDIDNVPGDEDDVLFLSENQIPPFVDHKWEQIDKWTQEKDTSAKTGNDSITYTIYKGKKLGD